MRSSLNKPITYGGRKFELLRFINTEGAPEIELWSSSNIYGGHEIELKAAQIFMEVQKSRNNQGPL